MRVPAPVEVDLGLAIGKGIDVDAEARRPVVVEYVRLVGSVELLFFPTETDVEGYAAIDGPGVIDVGGDVAVV